VTAETHHRVLAANQALLRVTLYYAKLNRSLSEVPRREEQ
jgi:hypothetical protein